MFIGSKWNIVSTPVRRSDDVSAYHAQQGIPDSVIAFACIKEAPETSKAAVALRDTIAKAYDAFNKAAGEKLSLKVGGEQWSTAFELCKQDAVNNLFPADIQSTAHKTNLIDSGKVTVWKMEKGNKVTGTTKANLGADLDI